MCVFRLTSCCLCVSLDVGAKIIGVVCTLFAAMSAVLYGVPVVLLHQSPATMIFYSLACVISVMHFLTGCMMIQGLFQKRPALIWPWLTLSWLVGGTLLLLSSVGTVLMYFNGYVSNSYVTSAYSVYCMILLYLTIVVRSRREEILDEIKWDSGKRLMRPTGLDNDIYV